MPAHARMDVPVRITPNDVDAEIDAGAPGTIKFEHDDDTLVLHLIPGGWDQATISADLDEDGHAALIDAVLAGTSDEPEDHMAFLTGVLAKLTVQIETIHRESDVGFPGWLDDAVSVAKAATRLHRIALPTVYRAASE